VNLQYHMSWPGYDPFYNHNSADANTRRSFYGVDAVPWIQVGGLFMTNFPPFSQYYDTRINTPTPVSVEIAGDYDAGTGAIDVTVTVTTTENLPTDNVSYRVYVALAEDNIYFNGSNTTDWHRFVMRDLAPSAHGTVISFSGGLPQTAQVNASFTMDPIYAEEECHIIAWMQEALSKEVYNSARTLVTDLGDLTDSPTALPAHMALGSNYPNPFNPTTAIPVKVAETSSALLQIVGVDGRIIRTLHSGELAAGDHEFSWNGADGEGNSVASGVYMARLITRAGVQSERLVMLK
jgi:hypothetical protein